MLKNTINQVLIAIVVVFILIRVALPEILKDQINAILENDIENYRGHIDDLDLSILMGTYILEGLEIRKREGATDPLLEIAEVRIGIEWKSLWKGKIVAQVSVFDPVVRIFDSQEKDKQQYAIEEDTEHWKTALDKIVPIRVNFFHLRNGQVIFENKDIKGDAFSLSGLNGEARDLITVDSSDINLSPIFIKGLLGQTGKLSVAGGIKITQDPILFDVDVKLEKFEFTKVNELMRAYVPLDVNSGKLTLVAEGIGSEDHLRGYMKVFLDDLDIISIDQRFISGEHFLYEIGASFVNWILDVITDGAIATELSYESQRGEFNFDWSEALWNSLKNLGGSLDRDFKGISLSFEEKKKLIKKEN